MGTTLGQRPSNALPAAPDRSLRLVTEGLHLVGRSFEDDLILVYDKSARIVYDSRSGAPSGPAPLATFLERIPPQQRAVMDAALRDALSPGLPHALDFTMGAEAASARSFAGRVAPLRIGGEIHGAVLLGIDISRRVADAERLRRSDRLMRETEGAAHLGTWEWDVTQPHAWWSDELFHIYGLDPLTHVPTYQDYLTRVHADDRDRVMKATESVFKDHRRYSHDERIFRPDGSMRWLHTWAQAVLRPDGSLDKLVGVCQDITDQKVAEESMRQQLRAAKEEIAQLKAETAR